MKTKTLIGVLGFLLPMLNAPAQNKYLQIGDKLPDYQWDSTYNYDGRPLRISDFRGKAVILDFWASWCSSCIEHFPMADSMQVSFAPALAFVLVNPAKSMDSGDIVARSLAKYKIRYKKSLSLPVVYGDTLAFHDSHFRLLPHYVWIGQDGRVKAMTNAAYLTYSNVQEFLEGRELDWLVKDDYAGGSH